VGFSEIMYADHLVQGLVFNKCLVQNNFSSLRNEKSAHRLKPQVQKIDPIHRKSASSIACQFDLHFGFY
jgi:hypothetical protein